MFQSGSTTWMWSPGDNIQQALLTDLKATAKQLRFKLYAFTLVEAVDILIAKHQAGIDVAGILDRSQASVPAAGHLQAFAVADMALGGSNEAAQIARLRTAGVPLVIGNSSRGNLIHEKAYCRDGRYVGMGSYNWSLSAQLQENHICFTDDAELAARWLQNWSADWVRLKGPTLPNAISWGVVDIDDPNITNLDPLSNLGEREMEMKTEMENE